MTFLTCWSVLCQPQISKLCIIILNQINKGIFRYDIFIISSIHETLSCVCVRTHTESSKTFEVLKSRYITFVSALWRNASPLAAPRATFKRRPQERGWKYEPPVTTINISNIRHTSQIEQCEKMGDEELTHEQVILQATTRHKFIDQKSVFIFKAIPN